jgi:hypothetical protein
MTMKSIYFFLLGVREFRLSFTTNPGAYVEAYDRGREFAHCATLRHFDY